MTSNPNSDVDGTAENQFRLQKYEDKDMNMLINKKIEIKEKARGSKRPQ